MDQIILQAEPRQEGHHVIRELRANGRVPAVVYGAHIEAQPIAVNARDLHRVLVAAGSGLISLEIDGATHKVLTREVQRHIVKHYPLHVDFLAVSLTERLRVAVPIVMEGVAPVAASGDAVVVRIMDSVELECLPESIPQHVVAHLSSLKSVDDSIFVRDLVVPEGVRVMVDGGHVVISVTASRVAELEETTEEAAPEVEVVTKGKKDEEA